MKSGITNCTSLIFKNFKQKKSAFLMEALIIVVISLFNLVYLSMMLYLNEGNLLIVEDTYGKHHVSFCGDVDAVNKIREGVDGVKTVWHYNQISTTLINGENELMGDVRFVDNADSLYLDVIVNGSYPKEGEILLPSGFLYVNSIWEKGDEIGVIVDEDGTLNKYTVSGFYIPRSGGSSSGPAIVKGYTGADGHLDADVIFDSEWGIRKKSADLAKKYGINEYEINENRANLFFQGKNNILNVIMFLFLFLVEIFMVMGFISMRVNYSNREGAVLRSFGISKGKVIRLILLENFYITLIAHLCAILLSIIIGNVIFKFSGTSGVKARQIIFGNLLPVSIITLVFIIIIVMLVVFVNVLNGFKKSIYETLSAEQRVIIVKKKNHSKIHRKSSKNPVKAYILTSIKRNGWRNIFGIIVLSAGIAAFVYMTSYMKFQDEMGAIDKYGKPVYNSKVYLDSKYLKETSNDEVINSLLKIEGIEKCRLNPVLLELFPNIDPNIKRSEYEIAYYSETEDKDRYKYIRVEVYDEDELEALKPALAEGSVDIKDSGCILVNYGEPIIDSLICQGMAVKISDLKTGDHIKICDIFDANSFAMKLLREEAYDADKCNDYVKQILKKDAIKEIDLEIKGTVYKGLHINKPIPTIIISENYYRKMLGLDNSMICGREIYVRNDDNKELYEYRESICKIPGCKNIDYLSYQKTMYDDLAILSGIMNEVMLIAFLIGIVSLISTLLLNWDMTRKEYAILKSEGADNKRMVKLILVEKGIICFSSFVIGTVFGIAMNVILLSIMQLTNFTVIPVTEILLAFVIIVFITLLLTFIQSRILKTMNISEVLNKST